MAVQDILKKLVSLAFTFPEKFLHNLTSAGQDFNLFKSDETLYNCIIMLFDIIDSENLDSTEPVDLLFFKQLVKNRKKSNISKKLQESIIKFIDDYLVESLETCQLISDDDLRNLFKSAYSHKLSENALKHLNYCRSQLLQNPEDSKNILKNFNNALEHDFPDSSFGGRVFTLSQSLSEKIKLEHALAGAGKKIPGYETGFPILTQKTGGFEKELYVFSGASGMGKSTLLIQLAWQLVNESDNIRVILFSLDHSHIDVTTKIISQAGRLPVKYVKNPFIPDIDLENKRHEAIKMATHIKDRLQIVDEGKGTITIGDIENFIHSARVNKEDEFILIIDPVMKISCPENDFNPQKEIILARKLKRLSRENNMTIICSIDLKAQTKPPCKEHLKEYPTFMSEAYVLLMMYCDFVNNFETLFLEWQWNSEDLMVPITEISVVKNKMDEFRGKLFFRYFNSMAFYKECAAEEIQNYNEMLDNLDEWEDKEITVRPDGTTAPKVKNK